MWLSPFCGKTEGPKAYLPARKIKVAVSLSSHGGHFLDLFRIPETGEEVSGSALGLSIWQVTVTAYMFIYVEICISFG